MKNIMTVQHTQSEQHINKMIGSWADWDLTALGIEQAHRIGARLAAEIGGERYVMYSSDLRRAKHTAAIVAEHLGIEPRTAQALREFHLGEAIGHSKEWARSHLQCPVWAGTADWAKGVHDRPFLGAESKADVWNRVSAFLREIIAGTEDNVILVSHDGTLSILFALWLGLDLEMLNRCTLSGKTGGVSFLHEDADGNRSIARLNDMSYVMR